MSCCTFDFVRGQSNICFVVLLNATVAYSWSNTQREAFYFFSFGSDQVNKGSFVWKNVCIFSPVFWYRDFEVFYLFYCIWLNMTSLSVPLSRGSHCHTAPVPIAQKEIAADNHKHTSSSAASEKDTFLPHLSTDHGPAGIQEDPGEWCCILFWVFLTLLVFLGLRYYLKHFYVSSYLWTL